MADPYDIISYLSDLSLGAISEEQIASATAPIYEAFEGLDTTNLSSAEIKEALDSGDAEAIRSVISSISDESDDQKQAFLDGLGFSASQYTSEISEAVGNTPSDFAGLNNNKAPLNTIEAYDSQSVGTILDENEELVNDLLIDYLIYVTDNGLTGFDKFLESKEGKEKVKLLLNKILEKETGWFGYGGLDTSTNTAADIVNRLNELAGNVPSDSTDDAEVEISTGEAKQCVLLQLVKPLSDLYDENLKEACSDDTGINGLPYSGRIVKLNSGEPSEFVNYLSAVPYLDESFTKIRKSGDQENLLPKVIQPINDYRISFVKKHEDKLLELPVFYSANKFNHSRTDGTADSSRRYQPVNIEEANEEENPNKQGSSGARVETISNDDSSTIELRPSQAGFLSTDTTDVDISVTYAGGNPSTFRNDVDVSISFTSNTLKHFTKHWTYDGLDDDNLLPLKFNLFDLILFPRLEKNSEGYGRVFKSQFSPSYNRIRLAYISTIGDFSGTDPAINRFYNKNCNVLDLTPIDHELTRSDDGSNYRLTINYKGYVQSVLTSPETDALSNDEVKEKREKRDKLLFEAQQRDCSLRDLQKIQSELNILAQNDIKDVSFSMLQNLHLRSMNESIKGFGMYELSLVDSIRSNLRNRDNSLNIEKLKTALKSPKKDVTGQDSRRSDTTLAQTATAAVDFLEDTENQRAGKIYFFYLADLLDSVLITSSLFENTDSFSDPINKKRMMQQLRFIMGPFKDPDGNVINIGNIPISVDFFADWYKQNVTDKELFIYPCLSFIRDITERVITNLMNEICFAGLEDTKLLVKTSFFSGTGKDGTDKIITALKESYSKKHIKKFDLDKMTSLMDDLPLVQVNYKSNIIDYINYCAIYTRQNREELEQTTTLIKIPEFVLEGNFIGSHKASFSKTTQTGLREARYFRAGNSGITMLASVYNVTLTLDRPIHTFYPGQFIKIRIAAAGENITINGESRSIFAELGIDGYYSIEKVTAKINPRSGIDEVTLNAIWISSEDPYHGYRSVSTNSQSVEDPAQTAKNNACNAFVQASKEISIAERLDISIDTLINQINEEHPPPTEPPPTNEEIQTSDTGDQ